jgi:S-adenosylmethionine decarboxylase proenzyme
MRFLETVQLGIESCLVAHRRLKTMETHIPPALFSADLGGCADLADLAPGEITARFCVALRRAGATVVQELSHSFPGTGLTCVLILSESHAVLHTWPETGTVNIDIFSCSTRLRSLEAIDELRRSFGAQHVTVQEIARADGHSPRSDERG